MRRKIALGAAVLLFAMGLSFLLGWRVMPKLWPDIKEHVVYALLPGLRPEAKPEDTAAVYEPEPYVPETSAVLGDAIAADDSVIYYFYKPYCPYCAALEPLLAGLPQYVSLPDGTQSTVRMIAVNKSDEAEGALIAAYYEANAIAEEEQYVPAVLIGDRYLFPGDEITDDLMDALVAGEGTRTPLLGGAVRELP